MPLPSPWVVPPKFPDAEVLIMTTPGSTARRTERMSRDGAVPPVGRPGRRTVGRRRSRGSRRRHRGRPRTLLRRAGGGAVRGTVGQAGVAVAQRLAGLAQLAGLAGLAGFGGSHCRAVLLCY